MNLLTKSSRITIRHLSLSDIDDLMITLVGAGEFRTGVCDDVWSREELSPWIADPADCCFGALAGERLIGYCLAHLQRTSGKLHIENVFVAPEFRRTGIGKRLIAFAVKFAQVSVGQVRPVALVQPENTSGRMFFEAIGLEEGTAMLWFSSVIDSVEGWE